MIGTDTQFRPWVLEEAFNTLALRTPEWKYIFPVKGPAMVPWGPKIETGLNEAPQLYKGADIVEQKNVAPEYPDVVKRMNDIISAIRAENNAELRSLDALP